MGAATTEEDLLKQAAKREVAFNAKKKAKLERPNAASDKGTINGGATEKFPDFFAAQSYRLPFYYAIVTISHS